MDFSKLTEYLESLEEHYGIPGSDIIIKKGYAEVYRHMTGHSDYEKSIEVTDKDIYFLFSTSKLVTMTAVMQLIERQKIQLGDPVSKYLPEYKKMAVINREFSMNTFPLRQLPSLQEPTHPAANPIRIIDCMTMMAGFTYNINAESITALVAKKPNATTREVIEAYAKMPLMYEPGEYWSYSLGHDVLGAVIEVVSGMSFGNYLRENIFIPLGMDEIDFEISEENRSRISALYSVVPETGEIIPIQKKNIFKLSEKYESGGAGLAGTANSYIKLVEALANNGVGGTGARVLREETVQLFTKPVVSGKALELFHWSGRTSYGYGYGVRVRMDNLDGCDSPVGEFGWDGAAGAYNIVDTKNKISVFFTMHVMGLRQVYSEVHPTICKLIYEAMNQ